VLALLARLGYKHRVTGHGFRATASTWAHEAGYPPHAIEMQLAHEPQSKVAAAYNRSDYMQVRRQMLADYGVWLDACEKSVDAG
jgi:integrase